MKWPLIDPNFAIYQPDSLRARCKEKGEEGRGGKRRWRISSLLVFTSCLSLKKDSYLPLLSFHELACLREHLQHPNVACNSGVLQKLRVAEAEARMHHCTRPNTIPSTTAPVCLEP